MTLATISIEAVEVGNRLRSIGNEQVSALMSSIGDVGLLNPITVYQKDSGLYGLVAGAHRFEACRRLGLADIDAQIVDMSEMERQIAECDENLCSSSLTPSEKALFTAKRKEAYEALHPETVNGATGAGRDKVRQAGEANAADRFTVDTAAKTGESERSVQRNAERGEKVIAEVIDLITGTKLDTGTYLDRLKKLPPNEQMTAARRDLAILRNNERAAKPAIKVADAPLNDESAQERQVAALMSAWNKAGSEARQEFLDRIEAPVFDRGRVA